MKKMKSLIAIVAILSMYYSAMAFPIYVRDYEAARAAMTFLSYNYPDSTFTVDNIVQYCNKDSVPLLYEVIMWENRALLLSASRVCIPVLADYQNDGKSLIKEYREGNLPCNLTLVIDSYIEQIDSSFLDNDPSTYYVDKWDSLIAGEMYYVQNSGNVSPLLNTRWGQSISNNYDSNSGEYYAYNHFMPAVDTCSHAVVGCVAVAMGQIMNYWKTPIVTPIIDAQFDWCNMPNSLYDYTADYEVKRNAVAHLLAECAMYVVRSGGFGCEHTSARSSNARDVLVDLMGYDRHADYQLKNVFISDNSWKSKIRDNLDRGMPVYYKGRRTTGFWESAGHAFVCDGYRGDEFHINWGWRGYFNDFFRLDSLYPNSEKHYTHSFGAIFDIYPQVETDICDYSLPLELFYIPYYIINSSGTWEYNDYDSLPNTLPRPYKITPQTVASLVSAHSSIRSDFRTIPSGDTAVYRAHQEIILQDGFEAEWGSDFTAEIVPCPACDEPAILPIHPIFDSLFPLTQGGQDSLDAVGGEGMYGHLEDYGLTRAEVFPNPTSGELTIGTDGEAEAIVIYNATGRPVGGWSITVLNGRQTTLDVSPLPQGAYIAVVRTQAGTSAARFVKQ